MEPRGAAVPRPGPPPRSAPPLPLTATARREPSALTSTSKGKRPNVFPFSGVFHDLLGAYAFPQRKWCFSLPVGGLNLVSTQHVDTFYFCSKTVLFTLSQAIEDIFLLRGGPGAFRRGVWGTLGKTGSIVFFWGFVFLRLTLAQVFGELEMARQSRRGAWHFRFNLKTLVTCVSFQVDVCISLCEVLFGGKHHVVVQYIWQGG